MQSAWHPLCRKQLLQQLVGHFRVFRQRIIDHAARGHTAIHQYLGAFPSFLTMQDRRGANGGIEIHVVRRRSTAAGKAVPPLPSCLFNFFTFGVTSSDPSVC